MIETSLEITFIDIANKTSRFRLNRVKQPVDSAKVQALADFMVANDPFAKNVVKWSSIKLLEDETTTLLEQ